MTTKVLLSGFEPFGGEQINPSYEAVKKLNGKVIGDVELIGIQVPTVFGASIAVLTEAIERYQPDVVIAVGQAGGRAQITPERIAINVDDARIPDNKGGQPVDEPVIAGGPAAYWSTLPIKSIVRAIQEAGVPAAVSNTAGTFVCNHLFYGLMDYLQKKSPQSRGGFIHIPFLPEQALNNGQPSLSLEAIVLALQTAALESVHVLEDVRETGGTLH
ncbi:pyroglutamyl-peptidase I [Paenibacillus physcomitrellae]|uniref:Pyrrolidone-carboxylate peptidase n=1 Tax=Paenibacillus physcomitrellae TaxID=1619311 RepID=A0ABQ1FQA5_9BACL|nr:pyroglutamyl-peptidase I [Paenibacillus physcomitrellae]GGA26266.1 pyrrolidone-carboxylate peptidase [Paenibacillus physcomitrellae]